ncbi:hypothetical protein [Bradyrhizobium sp. CCBAU 11357]|uniref:hypothetical protein n=1 Tax=Bradyrhizobium sp. CCBAU 11357 TaxID=1630808 RepID=UPI002303FCC6|nr:hypothetical protein [Bradyrhizobium sp. CCBAU 11357]
MQLIQRSKAWSGGGWIREDTFYPFRGRAPQLRWDMWRHAAPVPDLHRLRKAQRTRLEPHETRKMLSGQKSVQSFGTRTSLEARRGEGGDATAARRPVNRSRVEVQVAPPSLIERKEEQTTGAPPVDASADVVKITPPAAIERESEQTIGAAFVDASADVAQVSPPSVIEQYDASTTLSLDGLVAMMMALVALGIPLLFHHKDARRVLAYAATRRSEARLDDARPVYLLCPPRIEADPDLESNWEASVRNVLSTIKEAEAEMASSRQLRKPA